jgi:large conductance mechanosensitive channel
MATQISLKRPAWVEEFQAFIMKGNVVDLAVGIIIGAAFTGVVGSLVKDLFTPLIGLLVGGIDFTNIFITLKGPSAPTLDAAKAAGAVTLNIGVFLNTVIQFLIVGFAVFWVVKGLSKLTVTKKAEAVAEPPPPPPPTPSELLLTEIRDLLAQKSA